MPAHTVKEKSLLLAYLIAHFPNFNKTKIKQLLKYGSVTVNGTITTAYDHPLRAGDKVDFLTQQTALKERLRSRLPFPIIYEDDWLIVIDKPAGLLTMGTERDKVHTAYWKVTAYLKAQSADGRGRIFIVHRLDREASGLLVFAKREDTKLALQENWDKAVKKYYAIVEGTLKKTSGRIESYLVEDKFRRVYSISENKRGSKLAVTLYRVLEQKEGYSLLDVTLVTGRKNQIRVQMSDLGHPIIGDVKYGSHQDPAGRLGLHAYYLSFKHPQTGEIKSFETDLPDPLLLSRGAAKSP